MDAAAAKAAYARSLRDRVDVSRAPATANGVRARVRGYDARELVGGIQQGDRSVILFLDDLEMAGFPLPLRKGDRIIWNGLTMAVMTADEATRRVGEVTVAVEVQTRGG